MAFGKRTKRKPRKPKILDNAPKVMGIVEQCYQVYQQRGDDGSLAALTVRLHSHLEGVPIGTAALAYWVALNDLCLDIEKATLEAQAAEKKAEKAHLN